MWDIDFISESDFRTHVQNTVIEYENALRSAMDLKEFNRNVIDPIKFVFDQAIYGVSWEKIIANEIVRQKDKTINNSIGYFHQKIFQYIIHREGCEIEVPENGKPVFPDDGGMSGWDVAFKNENGIFIDGRTSVCRIYAEVKNKHNTMNGSSSARTFKKMQEQIVNDDDCACCLVEAVAKKSRNDVWKKKGCRQNKLIRHLSIDEFYGIVTGDAHGFEKICMRLPGVIQDVIRENPINPIDIVPDNVYNEINELVNFRDPDEQMRFVRAIYSLAFGSYAGF